MNRFIVVLILFAQTLLRMSIANNKPTRLFSSVPSAEMGSLSGSFDNSPAARKSSLPQFEMGQQANQVPEMEIRVLKR